MKTPLREIFGYLPSACVALLESGPDGEQLMQNVVHRLGGQHIIIPVKITESHKLAEQLGFPAAQRVWSIWRGKGSGGEIEIYIPRMTMMLQKARRLRLLRMRADGLSVGDAAHRLGVTERTVYSMLRKSRELGETLRKVDLTVFVDGLQAKETVL